MRVALAGIFAGVVMAGLMGCTGSDAGCRKLRPNLYLCRFEDNQTFYLQPSPARQIDGGGLVGGVITSVGVSSECVVAKRFANYRGDSDGWMLFDSTSSAPRGPYSDQQLKADSRCGSVQTRPVADAWQAKR
jgi:hypothetical protein